MDEPTPRRRFRLSLRTTMILVALLGVMLGQGAVWWRARVSRLRMVAYHNALGQADWQKATTYPANHPQRRALAEAGKVHLESAWRYHHAANRPWRPFPPASPSGKHPATSNQ